jgi:hypothetical protein
LEGIFDAAEVQKEPGMSSKEVSRQLGLAGGNMGHNDLQRLTVRNMELAPTTEIFLAGYTPVLIIIL